MKGHNKFLCRNRENTLNSLSYPFSELKIRRSNMIKIAILFHKNYVVTNSWNHLNERVLMRAHNIFFH